MDFPMAISDPASSPRAATGILRSYVDDLKHWLSGIGKRYAVGLAILLVGTAAALTATGFGVAALFRFIELRYGPDVAIEALGCLFAVIGAIGVLAGILLLRRQIPSPPRPYRQVEELKRSALTNTLGLLSDRSKAVRNNPVGKVLIGAAAALTIGLMAKSSFSRSKRLDRKKSRFHRGRD
jgi:hypothetical protein